MREYTTGASKEDFLACMGARIEERYRREQISQSTYMKHRSTLNKLWEFIAYSKRQRRSNLKQRQPDIDVSQNTLPFCSLTHKFSHDFDAWLRTEHK